jgi:beta-glucosidase
MNRLRNWWVAISTCSILLFALNAQQPTPQYKNRALPIDTRIADLLGRMTLEEKVAQLESTWQNHSQGLLPEEFFVDDKGQLDDAKARVLLKNGLGQVSRPSEKRGPGEMAEFTNRLHGTRRR